MLGDFFKKGRYGIIPFICKTFTQVQVSLSEKIVAITQIKLQNKSAKSAWCTGHEQVSVPQFYLF